MLLLHRYRCYCVPDHSCVIDREMTCKMTVVPFTWSPRRETNEIMDQ